MRTPEMGPNADVGFILSNAERLVKVTEVCIISFGLADGVSRALMAYPAAPYDWHQAAAGFHGDTLLMAALRTSILLDRDESQVSFQGVYRRLKSPSVRADLLQVLSERHGPDNLFPPARADLIDDFFQAYSEIDWQVHSRLMHFRNLGIAHLTRETMSKSLSFGELRALISVISRLASGLQSLCHTATAFRPDMLEDYREFARKTMMKNLEPSAH